MSNVLSDKKRQQIIAVRRLGWSLRRIDQATSVRRETAGAYLKVAGIYVRPRGGWGRRPVAKTGQRGDHDSGSPDLPSEPTPYSNSKRSVSNCEPYREVIELGLNRGRNAMAIWQNLVSEHGFEPGLPKRQAVRAQATPF